MHERPTIDLHDLLRRGGFQRHQRRHDFREACRWKPTGRILFQQDPAGFEIDQVQCSSVDRRSTRRALGSRVLRRHDARQTCKRHHEYGDEERFPAQGPVHGVGLSPKQLFHRIAGLLQV